ncbi:MAG: hypothetical protein JJU05_06495 [Verrucomicrobia bacterium]|nr:hypothetical protein [Verrucomicrobiota bacterium]MCH8525711.1 hypothetical protein [Kiritimatiellia bacterium]
MEHKLEKWEKWRTEGPCNFILNVGVLQWGCGVAVIYTLVFALISGASLLRVFGLAMIVFPIMGIFWGAFMWRVNENAYMKTKLSE